MKKFLRQLVGFLLFLVGFALVIQLAISWRIRYKVVTGIDNLDMMEGQDNQLVFLGSSRCNTGFDPALYEKALGLHAANLGVDGHSELSMHLLRLENYLARHPAPKVAVLAFDPLVSTGSMDHNQNMVNKNQFARYAFWPSKINEPIVRYFDFDPLERTLPLYALLKYRVFDYCLTLQSNSDWLKYRYDRHDEHWDTIVHPIDTSTKMITSVYSGNADVGLEKELSQLDSVCARNHIRLVCVQTPMYRSAYIKERFDRTAAICVRLHVPFFDLCTPQLDGDIDNFYNVDHCNTIGMTKMAKALLSDPAFRTLFDAVKQDRLGSR